MYTGPTNSFLEKLLLLAGGSGDPSSSNSQFTTQQPNYSVTVSYPGVCAQLSKRPEKAKAVPVWVQRNWTVLLRATRATTCATTAEPQASNLAQTSNNPIFCGMYSEVVVGSVWRHRALSGSCWHVARFTSGSQFDGIGIWLMRLLGLNFKFWCLGYLRNLVATMLDDLD